MGLVDLFAGMDESKASILSSFWQQLGVGNNPGPYMQAMGFVLSAWQNAQHGIPIVEEDLQKVEQYIQTLRIVAISVDRRDAAAMLEELSTEIQ